MNIRGFLNLLNNNKKINGSFFKSTAIYAISDCLGRAITFLVLPLVSYYIVPEQLGIESNFGVLQSIVLLLAGQVIVNALPYFYYEERKKDIAVFVTSMLALVSFLSILFSIISLFCHPIVEKYLHLSFSLQLLVFVSVTANLLQNISQQLFRLEEKPIKFAIYQLSYIAIYIPLLIYLVVGCRMQALGKIYSNVIAISLIGILHFVSLWKRGYLTFCIDYKIIRRLLSFGIPLLPHSLSFWIKSGVDKILLTTYCGLGANGIYSMAMTFGAVYSIFNTAFFNTYIPYLQKRLSFINNENREFENRRIVLQSYKICLLFLIVCIMAIILSWLAIECLLSKVYLPSLEYLPWIFASLTIYSFYNIVIQYPYTIKKTKWLGVITFSGSCIQALLSWFFVMQWGADGIKYSLVLGSIIIMLGVWIYSNKVYPMPWLHVIKNRKI